MRMKMEENRVGRTTIKYSKEQTVIQEPGAKNSIKKDIRINKKGHATEELMAARDAPDEPIRSRKLQSHVVFIIKSNLKNSMQFSPKPRASHGSQPCAYLRANKLHYSSHANQKLNQLTPQPRVQHIAALHTTPTNKPHPLPNLAQLLLLTTSYPLKLCKS